jgi:hypothetical protein
MERAEGRQSLEQAMETPPPHEWIRSHIRMAVQEGIEADALEGIRAKVRSMTHKLQIAACETPEDFRNLFTLYGVLGEEWRSSGCFVRKKLSGLYDALIRDNRFRNYAAFLKFMGAAMIDASVLQLGPSKQVSGCRTPDDFRSLFRLHSIPGEAWRMPERLRSHKFSSFYRVIVHDERFKSWKAFIAFMGPPKVEDGILQLSFRAQVSACVTPDDFRNLFALHGIEGNGWKKSGMLIKMNLKDLCKAITHDQRFGGYPKFVAWMEGREFFGSIRTQVQSCVTRDDFLMLFKQSGIPGHEWRSTYWMRNIALLSPKQGGIGKNLSGVAASIGADERFASYQHFVAWMDGMPIGGVIASREQATELLQSESKRLGVPVHVLLSPDPKRLKENLRRSVILRKVFAFFESHPSA